jgi:hypothetical protein
MPSLILLVLHEEHTCSHVNHYKTRAKNYCILPPPPFPPLYKRTRGTGNLAKKLLFMLGIQLSCFSVMDQQPLFRNMYTMPT